MRLMFVFICTGVWQFPSSFGRQDPSPAKTWGSVIIVLACRSGQASCPPAVLTRVLAPCSLSCYFLLPLSPKDRAAGGISIMPRGEQGGPERGCLEYCQSSWSPGAKNSSLGRNCSFSSILQKEILRGHWRGGITDPLTAPVLI